MVKTNVAKPRRLQAKQLRPALEVKYFNDMRGLEHDYHKALKSLYYYHAFHTEI